MDSATFTPDGKRLFAWDLNRKALAWTVADGKPTDPRNPPPMPQPGSARSPGNRLVAKPDGLQVLVIDLLQPPAPDTTWKLPDRAERLRYHSEQATLCEQAKQHFAAAFHLGRMLLDDPDNAELKHRRETALKEHAARW